MINKTSVLLRNIITKMERSPLVREQPYYTFNNGFKMPMIGLGTFGFKDPKIITQCIDIGYRAFDTASYYNNENTVGEAVKTSIEQGDVTRDELFIVTKVWMDEVEDVEAACKRSLEKLGVEYIDLYLVHWPVAVRRIKAPNPAEGDVCGVHERINMPLHKIWP
jgi:diketogulonate reductase-like aldo/keto reductase